MHHYGIIAGICDEIGLVKEIDQLVNSDPQRKISVGECVKAMIINGMGYTTRPMYLANQFFESKPMMHLIKKGIEPKDLNDDTLGRALDKLFENDCTKIFSHIALNAAHLQGVNLKYRHLDTTNMQMHGKYEDQNMELVSFGYPKKERADLKQFLISMMVSNDGGVPFFAKAIPGNTSDGAHFREVLGTLEKNIKNDDEFYTVIDSAFYSEKAVQLDILWITHVPDKIKQVKELKNRFLDAEGMTPINENYKFAEINATYGGIEQRWIVVYSKNAHNRAIKTVPLSVKKEKKESTKLAKKIAQTNFLCEDDATAALNDFEKKLKFHTMKADVVKKELSNASTHYNATITISPDNERIEKTISLKSMFVLGTNQLDVQKLPPEEILSYYKDQNKVERGFRFLKDPLCLASAVYLKNDNRIVALAMIMCLCLLIYSLAERKLRKAIKKYDTSVPSQTGKPTKKPTMKWVFQMFEGVIIARVDDLHWQMINLSEKLKNILELLGKYCMKMYLLFPN